MTSLSPWHAFRFWFVGLPAHQVSGVASCRALHSEMRCFMFCFSSVHLSLLCSCCCRRGLPALSSHLSSSVFMLSDDLVSTGKSKSKKQASRSTAAAPLCIDMLGFWLRVFVFGIPWILRLLGGCFSCSVVACGCHGDLLFILVLLS